MLKANNKKPSLINKTITGVEINYWFAIKLIAIINAIRYMVFIF